LLGAALPSLVELEEDIRLLLDKLLYGAYCNRWARLQPGPSPTHDEAERSTRPHGAKVHRHRSWA
jgi:hypothetical protein